MKYQDSHLDWTNGQTAQYIFSQCEGYLSMSSYYSNSFWFALAEQVDRRPRDTTQKQSLKCIFFYPEIQSRLFAREALLTWLWHDMFLDTVFFLISRLSKCTYLYIKYIYIFYIKYFYSLNRYTWFFWVACLLVLVFSFILVLFLCSIGIKCSSTDTHNFIQAREIASL